MKKILIIEDDKTISDELKILLDDNGYDSYQLFNFHQVAKKIIEFDPDLVLLDINLPYYDGFYICRELRKSSNIPIIVVTSRDSDMDELMSINLGADDFITKPYNTQILLARIGTLLKRTYNNSNEIFKLRELTYNLSTSEATFLANKIDLTKNESKILYILFQNKGKIVSRDKLIKALWQDEEFVDDNTLTVNINRLRKKLEELGAKDYLQTKRGQGYILL